jgi:nucleotide-binding universal stress UspA family protein
MTVLVVSETRPGTGVLDRAIEEAQRVTALLLVSVVEQDPKEASPDDAATSSTDARTSTHSRVASRPSTRLDRRRHVCRPATSTPDRDPRPRRRATGVDLIVIGMRRRSRVGKLLLGSTAQDVLLGADCAVLAVRSPPSRLRPPPPPPPPPPPA